MVPKAQLFMMIQITAASSSKAVASKAGFWPKPPSPTSDTTTLSGAGDLGADRGRRAEAHGGVTARRQHRAGRIDGKLLADAVLVPADIGGDDGVARQHRAHIRQNPLGPHGILVGDFGRGVALLEFGLR